MGVKSLVVQTSLPACPLFRNPLSGVIQATEEKGEKGSGEHFPWRVYFLRRAPTDVEGFLPSC